MIGSLDGVHVFSEADRNRHEPTSQVPGSNGRRQWLYLVSLITIVVVSRLPQLMSPNLLLDGDECTLGLMAKHVAQGKDFPVFFYGQHYGLSSIEAIAGALSFLSFGTSALSLKLAMLALWTVGVVFLFLAQSRLLGMSRGFWITALLVLNPIWAVWSMKARGGYITSFTATAALLWLLMRSRDRTSAVHWLLAGVLTSVIYLAQPLWLPGLLPILGAFLISRRRLSYVASFIGVVGITILLVRTWGRAPLGNPDLLGSLPKLAEQIYVNFTGAYYLWWTVDPPGPATKVLAIIWCGLLVAVVLTQCYRLLSQ